MPKYNLTANGVQESYGWIPPIHEKSYNEFVGGVDSYDNKMRELFHKILKENFMIDLEADPEDAAKRIVASTAFAREGLSEYLRDMQENSQMPDSGEKFARTEHIASEYEKVLFNQFAKGALLIIPPDEKEPRQLRFDPRSQSIKVSEPLSKWDPNTLDKLYEDGTEKIAIPVLSDKPRDPGTWTEKPPKQPTPPDPMTRKDPGKAPTMMYVPPMRKEPVEPTFILKDTTREKMIEEEYQRLFKESGLQMPTTLPWPDKVPPFTRKPPVEVQPPRNLQKKEVLKPEKPQAVKDMEALEAEVEKINPPRFDMQKYTRLPDPPGDLPKEPLEPVFEMPVPPEDPPYLPLRSQEPKPPHMLPPVLKLRLPEMEVPRHPDPVPPLKIEPFTEEYPMLRKEPGPRPNPSFFQRMFTNWRRDLANFEADHQAWEHERDTLEQRRQEFEQHTREYGESVNKAFQDHMLKEQEYQHAMETYEQDWKRYSTQLAVFERENDLITEEFYKDSRKYFELREQLGDQYDKDMNDYKARHDAWVEENKDILLENEKIKAAHVPTQIYEAKKRWFEEYFEPYMGTIEQNEARRKELTRIYGIEKREYDAQKREYDSNKKSYDNAIERARKKCEEQDRLAHGNDPDFEEKREQRVGELMAENATANEQHKKAMADYDRKMEEMSDRLAEMRSHPDVVKYNDELMEFEEAEDVDEINELEQERYQEYQEELEDFRRAEAEHKAAEERYQEQYAKTKASYESLDARFDEYNYKREKMRETATKTVDEKIRLNTEAIKNFPAEREKWWKDNWAHYDTEREAYRVYVERKDDWRDEKEAFEKEKEAYDKKKLKYDQEVKEFPEKLKDYNRRYQEYVDKLTKWENEILAYNKLDKEIKQFKKEVRETHSAHINKVNEDPKMKDYYSNKGNFIYGNNNWNHKLEGNKVVQNWQKTADSKDGLARYLDEHEARMKRYASRKKSAGKTADFREQKAYEQRVIDEAMFGKYPADMRPFFKKLHNYEKTLDNSIRDDKNISEEKFKKMALSKMYCGVLRNAAEKYAATQYHETHDGTVFDSLVNDERIANTIGVMMKDEKLMKSVSGYMTLSASETAKMNNLKWTENDMRQSKLRNGPNLERIYGERYFESKKLVKDPVLEEYHGPEKAVQKAMKAGK